MASVLGFVVMVWGIYFIFEYLDPYPKAPRTHILRLLGPKTILYRAFGLF